MVKRFLGWSGAVSVCLAPLFVVAGCSGDDASDAGLDTTTTGGASAGVGGTASSGGANGAGGGATGGGANGSGGAASCTPGPAECELATGLEVACMKRFALGVNYAWHSFAADFGGIGAWAQPGITNNPEVATDLAAMRTNGVSVVRWWMFPDFRGDGVTFDENGDPTGLSAGAIADIQKALELAATNDLRIVLTVFSFDNFRPTRDEGGLTVRGMTPMVQSATRRATLIQNVVRPIAAAVAASPHADRLLGWDVINEPEWAVAETGSAPNGGEFSPNEELDAVSLADMKALINESLVVLKEVTPHALTSVGWAAAKWQWAFDDVTNVDFHQPHIYAWVNDYWPYSSTPAELGYDDKPTVMGEYYLAAMPLTGSSTVSFAELNTAWFDSGYAGAWSWQWNENASDAPLISAFATAQGCQVGY